MSNAYRILSGSIHEEFAQSRAKIQIFGGGFGNGKTAAACIKALQLARDYPGSNGLIARATYPKLNDTIRKEFVKWCPKEWIKSFPMSANASNTCTLMNGSEINFRYVQQKKSEGDNSTSNLLSATYDWIVVDQMDDPEFQYKDFTDLMGRLRGSTLYRGSDPTMPRTGPRWFVITLNPTRNWFFRRLVKPYHAWQKKKPDGAEFLRMCTKYGAEDNPLSFIHIIEGSTYANKANLEADYLRGLEATYDGAQYERYVEGKWGGYEGLVYDKFDENVHIIPHDWLTAYYVEVCRHYHVEIVEAYDHGLIRPTCYGLAFIDPSGNVCLMDGFHEADLIPEDIIKKIKELRQEYEVEKPKPVYADPSIFKRTTTDKKTVGKSTADILHDDGMGIRMQRGNNDIQGGIIKIKSYMRPQSYHVHPFTQERPAPYIYISDKLQFFVDEITDFYWKKDTNGEFLDVPVDGNDHAMDMLRYLFTARPKIAEVITFPAERMRKAVNRWRETEVDRPDPRRHRYGRGYAS